MTFLHSLGSHWLPRLFLLALLCPSTIAADPHPLLLQIGPIRINARAIMLRQQIETAYGANTLRDGICIALINDALDEVVARRIDIAATQDEVESLARHADQSSRNPELLAWIKSLFAQDESLYRRLYLRPKITSDKLHAYHSRSRDIHRAQTTQIEAAQRLIQDGMGFAQAAERLGLHYHQQKPRKGPADIPQAMSQFGFNHEDMPPNPFHELLDTLESGAIHPKIIETDGSFLLIRLLEKAANQYPYESITIGKRPYADWFRQQAAEIPIHISDSNLRRGINEHYPQLWWVKERLILPR